MRKILLTLIFAFLVWTSHSAFASLDFRIFYEIDRDRVSYTCNPGGWPLPSSLQYYIESPSWTEGFYGIPVQGPMTITLIQRDGRPDITYNIPKCHCYHGPYTTRVWRDYRGPEVNLGVSSFAPVHKEVFPEIDPEYTYALYNVESDPKKESYRYFKYVDEYTEITGIREEVRYLYYIELQEMYDCWTFHCRANDQIQRFLGVDPGEDVEFKAGFVREVLPEPQFSGWINISPGGIDLSTKDICWDGNCGIGQTLYTDSFSNTGTQSVSVEFSMPSNPVPGLVNGPNTLPPPQTYSATCDIEVNASCDDSHTEGELECENNIEYEWQCQEAPANILNPDSWTLSDLDHEDDNATRIECPENHVLTGRWDTYAATPTPRGKCAPLPSGVVLGPGSWIGSDLDHEEDNATRIECPDGHVLTGRWDTRSASPVNRGKCAPLPSDVVLGPGSWIGSDLDHDDDNATRIECPENHVLTGRWETYSASPTYRGKCAPLSSTGNLTWTRVPTGEICGSSCTGALPTNATLCPNDDTGLSVDTARTAVDTCSAPEGSDPKCEYECDAGFELVGGVCQPVSFSCIGRIPENAVACPGTLVGLTADTPYSIVSSCNSSNKCEYTCPDSYRLESGDCVPIECTGPVPENASLCENIVDTKPLLCRYLGEWDFECGNDMGTPGAYPTRGYDPNLPFPPGDEKRGYIFDFQFPGTVALKIYRKTDPTPEPSPDFSYENDFYYAIEGEAIPDEWSLYTPGFDSRSIYPLGILGYIFVGDPGTVGYIWIGEENTPHSEYFQPISKRRNSSSAFDWHISAGTNATTGFTPPIPLGWIINSNSGNSRFAGLSENSDYIFLDDRHIPTGSDTTRTVKESCTDAVRCEYTCDPGYIFQGGSCVEAGLCLNEPDNAIVCPGDFLGVLVDTPSTVVDTCSAPEGSDPKCEYTCAPGFHNDGGVCVPDACVPDAMCTIPGLTVGGEACNVCCTDSEAIDWVNPATSLTEKICCKATPNHVACGVNPRTNDRGQSCGSVGAECSGECLCTDNACIDDPDGEPAEVHSVCCAAADQEFNPITNQDECPCDSCPGSSVVHIKDPVSGICYEQGPLLVEFNDQVLDGILHENMNFTLSDGIQKKCCQYGRVPGTNQCYCDPAQTQEPQLNGTTGEYDCPCCDGNQSGGDYYFLAPNGQCRLDGEPTGDVCSSGSCPVGTRNVGGVCCDLTNIVLDDDGNEVCESCDTRPDDPTCRGGTTPITGNYGICTSGQQIATTITCDDGTNNCVGVEIIDPDGGTRVFYEGSETTVTGSFNISFTDPTNAEFSILPRLGATINFRLIDAASNITNYYIYNGTNDTVAPTIPADGDVWFRINGADTTSGGDKKRGEYIEWTRTAVVAHAECLDSQNPGIDSIFCGCAAINDDMTTTHSLGYVDTFGNTITPHPLDTTNVLYSRLHEDNSGPGETFEFPIVDTAGNDGGVAQYTVDFIDRDAPDLSGSFSTDGGSTWNANLRDIRATDFESGDVQFRVTATDSQSLLWGEQMDIRGFTTSQGTAEGFYDDLCNQSVSVSELEGYRQRYGALPGGGNEGDASESRSISLNSVSPDATFFYVYACTQDNAGNIMARRFTFGTGGLGILGTADDMKGFSYSGASSRPSTECITRHWNALAQVERDAIPAEDEEAQQELFCYYRRILSAVEDEQPNLNQAFGESNNQRIRELNQAISQNIGSLTRGFEGFGSPYIYTHLDNLSEEEYTVPRKELIYYRLPPGVAEIEGNTGQIISLDRNAGVSTTTLDSFRVTGQKTIIIEGGNLHIKTDMAYGGRDDMVVFVVKRDPEGHGGNVYVDKDVTNIVGLFFIDGAFMNVEGSVPNLTVLNAAQHEEKLRKQLLIYGMVSSKNTRGGSFSTNESSELINAERLIASDGIGSLGHCPFGTDYEFGATVNSGEYYNCPITYATAIDFEVFRTLGLMEVTQDTIDFLQTTNCTQIGKRVPITMVGGESRELLYAWSGKRRCYQSEDTLFNLRATDKKFRTYIEFDSRGIREDFDILDRR